MLSNVLKVSKFSSLRILTGKLFPIFCAAAKKAPPFTFRLSAQAFSFMYVLVVPWHTKSCNPYGRCDGAITLTFSIEFICQMCSKSSER